MVIDVEVLLAVLGQVERTVILNGGISIPLDVCYLGVLREQVVHNLEYEVLHLGIGHVEHQLRASAPQFQVAPLCLQGPLGVTLEEFAFRVHHLRLYPDAELNAAFAGSLRQRIESVGQFVLVHHPVSQAGGVVLSRILVAEPTVVHDEQLAAKLADVVHHGNHARLVDVEVEAFPRVQEDVARLHSAVQHAFGACPAVEVTAGAAQAFVGKGESKMRRLERLLRVKDVFAGLRVDACIEVMFLVGYGVETEFEVAAPAEGSTNDAATVLLRPSVEGNHDFGRIEMSVTRSVGITDDFHAACQRLRCRFRLCCPVAVHVRYPYIPLAQSKMARVETLQGDGLLLGILNLCPRLNDVHLVVCLVENSDSDGLQLVLHREDVGLRSILRFQFVTLYFQFKVQVAVGMQHLQSGQLHHVHGSESWQGRRVEVGTGIAQFLQAGNIRAIIGHAKVAAFMSMQEKHSTRSLYSYIATPCVGTQCSQQWEQKQDESFHIIIS